MRNRCQISLGYRGDEGDRPYYSCYYEKLNICKYSRETTNSNFKPKFLFLIFPDHDLDSLDMIKEWALSEFKHLEKLNFKDLTGLDVVVNIQEMEDANRVVQLVNNLELQLISLRFQLECENKEYGDPTAWDSSLIKELTFPKLRRFEVVCPFQDVFTRMMKMQMKRHCGQRIG